MESLKYPLPKKGQWYKCLWCGKFIFNSKEECHDRHFPDCYKAFSNKGKEFYKELKKEGIRDPWMINIFNMVCEWAKENNHPVYKNEIELSSYFPLMK